jgi:hypothetical protein
VKQTVGYAGARFVPLGFVGLAACCYLSAFGGLLAWLAAADPVDAIGCAAPLLLAMLLARTSQADRQQYIARLMAVALMSPLLQLMLFGDRLAWPPIVALAIVHFATVVGAVFWLASATTRIAPPIGAAPTPPEQLLKELQALPMAIRRDAASPTWIVDHRFETDEARSHRILLDLDASRGTVFVREQIGASGARPREADEASMRRVGDDIVDAARPDAQFIWSRCWQTSIINLDQLAAPAPANDPDTVVLQLCALVLRCGWTWQPVLIRPR